ncbi:fasciclin domain-containing protein [Planctomycetaceae bacterium SH139]
MKFCALLAAVAMTFVATPLVQADEAKEMTIVETAIKVDGFNTLVAAVKAGGLVEALSGEGPFTVFAPTDEAFAALPKGTLEMLLKPENKDKLVAILKYHVVAGNVMAADVVKIKGAKTLADKMVKVKVTDGGVMINNAKVVKADVKCSNGVIHVINKVLLPK